MVFLAGTTGSTIATEGNLIKLVDTELAAEAASIDASGLDTYDAYLIVFNSIGKTAGLNPLYMRFNNDSAANYNWNKSTQTANAEAYTNDAAATEWYIGDSNQVAGNAIAWVTMPTTANSWLQGVSHSSFSNRNITCGLTYNNTTPITRFTVWTSAGNLDAGTRLIIFGVVDG